MVQATEDRTCHHTAMCRQSMPMGLERHRQCSRWLRDAWTQGHVRPSSIIMRHPYGQQTPEMVRTQWNEAIETFPPPRADEPLAERMGLRRPHRRLEHPQAQVADALVKLWREEAIAVMNQA